MKIKILLIVLLTSFFMNMNAQSKRYIRTYYRNGILKSEGWQEGNKRDGYWKLYHSSGNISEMGHYKNDQKNGYWYSYSRGGILIEEGHYSKGEKNKWWLFYDDLGNLIHKCQLDKGIKNGYCLMYENEELTSALKYRRGKKLKEWHDFKSFKRENNLLDLK